MKTKYLKRIFWIIATPIIVVSLSISAFNLLICFERIQKEEITYYFPQIETYVKIYNPPGSSNYGYVFFSKDSIISFSESIDFVRILKGDTHGLTLIFDPDEPNNMYIINGATLSELPFNNQVNFTMRKTDIYDTTFFDVKYIPNSSRSSILKPQYFKINVNGYLNYLSSFDESGFKKFKTIKK